MYLRSKCKMMTLGISQKLIAAGSGRATGRDAAVVSALPVLIQGDCKCPEVCSCSLSAFWLCIQSKHSSLDNCRQNVPWLSPGAAGSPSRSVLGHIGIVINDRRQHSKENVSLKYMSFKDVSLDKMCFHLELLISVRGVNHYILCLDNINAFFDKLNP